MVALAFVVILGVLYWGIARDLVSQWWNDDNYTHGFLVPVFSGFLVWQRRAQLAAVVPNGSWLGFPVLLAESECSSWVRSGRRTSSGGARSS
jgi:hypothetical protein